VDYKRPTRKSIKSGHPSGYLGRVAGVSGEDLQLRKLLQEEGENSSRECSLNRTCQRDLLIVRPESNRWHIAGFT
jgi:hypothetical protein